jgi:glycosyltransferase involved in cell wall biosynthesis/ribosomal protein S18 acetylase RimI-like enzyme
LSSSSGCFAASVPPSYTHNPKPGIYGRIAARLAGVPVVVNTLHGLYALPSDAAPKRAFVYGLERLVSTCSDAELVQNPEDAATLRRLGVPDDKVLLLGNGIDLRRFDPETIGARDRTAVRAELGAITPTDVVVGVVGRLVREKGYQEIFDAAAQLRHRCPAVRFAVIGPDEPQKRGSVSRDAKAAAAASGVVFLGSRADVERLYRGMDLYLLASHREGVPRSAMEAASMGLPIVATDIRGCREVVESGVTGLLVPPRNPAALADAIAALAVDPGQRRRMGMAGRNKALQEFDQQRCIDLTLSVYHRLLARAGMPFAGRVRALSDVQASTPRWRVRPAVLDDVASVARLHRDRFPNGFLPTLGSRPLQRLYRHLVQSGRSFVLVADDDEGVIGFVAVAEDTRRLYRDFLRRDGVAAALVAAPAALRAPRRVWETLRYGERSEHAGLPPAEILAVAVADHARGTGVASSLVHEALNELRRRNVRGVRVVTAIGNEEALRLYARAGFRHRRFIEVHRGVRQEVLVWP